MNRPNEFIINSQFPTTKNVGWADGNIVIPGSFAIPGGQTAQASLNVSSGEIGAISRGRILSSKSPTNWYVSQSIGFPRMGTDSGFPAPYTIVAFMRRSSATTLTFQVLIKNESATTLTCEASGETIYFYSNQFIAPYA